jgi:vacuolar-type H+-ATPase subunit I/STV1
MTLISGIMGQKKRIHIHVGDVLEKELDSITEENDNQNKRIQALAQVIDDSILNSYKLWPTNYIAYDLLNDTNRFAAHYTEKEKNLFERRLEMRIDGDNKILREGFLAMYANPVVNKMKYENAV